MTVTVDLRGAGSGLPVDVRVLALTEPEVAGVDGAGIFVVAVLRVFAGAKD